MFCCCAGGADNSQEVDSGGKNDGIQKENDSAIARHPSLSPIITKKHSSMKDGGFAKHGFIVTNKGRIDDQYKMEGGEIGKGTYGSVKIGTNKSTGANRAIKTIPKSRVTDINKLTEEIEIMKVLDHPNIIKLYETFEDARCVYLVMELCSGGELFDKIVKLENGFSEKITATLMKQISGAVLYMHCAQIAHRDLKPENFLFVNDKDVSVAPLKVIDFGISKHFVKNAKKEDKMFTKACTPYYVAPEVLEGTGYTELCDVWSLGVLTYIFLSGRPPFGGNSDNQILANVKKGCFGFDYPVFDKVSGDAKDLISNMLVLDPSKRYTMEKVLRHPWMEKLAANAKGGSLSEDAFTNLKKFVSSNNLKKMALTVVAQQLPEDVLKDLKGMFLALDKNGDGTITYEEMKEGIEKEGEKLGFAVPSDIYQFMEDLDTDGSGSIDYSEFLAATLDKKHYHQEEICWAAFRVFDADGNGKITKDELTEILTGGQCKEFEEAWGMNRQMIEKAIIEVDLDGDGKIDFDEFLVMMREKSSVSLLQ